ncbi:MAG: hypothetical protein AAB955_02750 [Patescibacteria group bacterium]
MLKVSTWLHKSVSAVTITTLLVASAGSLVAPVVAQADAPSILKITCDAVVQNGNDWTFSGTWTAIDFPGLESAYDAALFSPTGTIKDSESRTAPDTFIATSTGTSFAGASNKNDAQGTWSNIENFSSAPASVNAVLYHQGVPGNESSNTVDGTCSFAPLLTKGGLVVKKVLINDNGGTAATSTFSFTIPGVNGGNSIAFEADGQNDFTLTAGAYTVTEVAAAGYAAAYSVGCAQGVTAGATTTCTITNNDVAPKLTVTKVVTNDSGGTKVIAGFPLFVDGNSVTSGVQNTFLAGAHTVTETGIPTEYAATISGDCAADGTITLAVGDVKACTITNNDIAPKLTVTKVLNFTHGGTKIVSDFQLLLDNVVNILSGVQNTLTAGAFTVGEVATLGYSGVVSGDCAADGTITLALGEVKTCTVTNSDVAPALTLTKIVSGGPNVAADWTLTAAGPTPLSGTAPVASDVDFTAGTYTLGESAGESVSPYYVASAWVCTGGVQVSNTVALTVGQSASCTITNTYTPPVCDDGIDNDGDTFVDADDVGCESPTDTSEANESTLLLCTDGQDNDGDELIDLADSNCSAYIPTLTVVKNLINDSNTGGTLGVTDFAFQINGGDMTSFDGDGSVTTNMPVGAYSVTESAAGYTTSFSADCSGSLAADEDKICTITNDDLPTTITVVKSLITDSGKSAAVTDFSFAVNDNDPVSFDEDGSVTLTVVPGDAYSIVETVAAGYTTTYQYGETESCGNITITLGQNVQCTIINDDVPACSDGIENDGDGLTDMDDPGCHTDLDPENSESYDANLESEGNESTLALCTDGIDNDNDTDVDFEDADCAPLMPTIKLVKTVTNDSGTGTSVVADFVLNVGATAVLSGATTAFVPGAYTVTETGPAGYTGTIGGHCAADGTITLVAGETYECTITNDDIVAPPVNGQCNDTIDNEGDTLIDQQDPQCSPNGVYDPGATEAGPSSGGPGGGGIIGGGGGGSVLGASTVGQVLGTSCGVYMDRYVRIGKKNNVEQVKKLQAFLNKQGAALPLTGFFGPLSLGAVMKFQAQYADSILKPWGITTPTGIVYQTTLWQINKVECPELTSQVPTLIEWSKSTDPAKPE